MTHKIAILGASGYTGAELVRLIAEHPNMDIVALAAERKAGMTMAQVFPHLRHMDLPDLCKISEIDFSRIDLCFCALPHKTSQEVISALPKDLKIIDLSADFRLTDPDEYEKWYGNPHTALEQQEEAVYGLTEFYRDEIRDARLVAGTGCNAATGQYVLRPLISAGVIDLDDIVLDLKCAVSGAGRSLKENLLHAELSEGAQCLCRRRDPQASGRIRSGVFQTGRAYGSCAVHTAPYPCKPGHSGHDIRKRRPAEHL